MSDMKKWTVAKLKEECKRKGIKNYSGLKKEALIKKCLGKTPTKKSLPKPKRKKRPKFIPSSSPSPSKQAPPLPKNIDVAPMPPTPPPQKKVYGKRATSAMLKKFDKAIAKIEAMTNKVRKMTDELPREQQDPKFMPLFIKRNKEQNKLQKAIDKLAKDLGKAKYDFPGKYQLYM